MATRTEMAKLMRALDDVRRGVDADLKSRAGISAIEKRALRSDIETCMQQLDELRTRLGER